MANVYEIVTEQILKKLEGGTIPWQKPWNSDGSIPMNLVSKKEYRGMNLWLLPTCYSSPYFVSFKQCKDMGGNIKAGEKGNLVTFWKIGEREEKDATGKTEIEKTFLLRYYYVWNIEQTTIPAEKIPVNKSIIREFSPIESCEKIAEGMPKRPEITHNEARAYYRPTTDSVNMPKQELFNQETEYYSTLFHELAHSTGHTSRLNRKELVAEHGFGSQSYSREELVAELSAAYLCAVAGIERSIENSAAYIQSWISALRHDSRCFVVASSSAQKAADFILNKQIETA